MRMGQGVRTGLGHGGITCVLQTQFSSFFFDLHVVCLLPENNRVSYILSKFVRKIRILSGLL